MHELSPLVRLALREPPDVLRLYEDIKRELLTATAQDVWARMLHNHEARFCIWDMHTLKCRKPELAELPPGTAPSSIFPWPGAADHEVRLTEEVITEMTDLLMIAARRAQTSIAPSTLDIANEQRMKMAEAWGQVRQAYLEDHEQGRDTALCQMADYAWEYGHGLALVSWREEYQAVPRTVNAEQLLEMVTSSVLSAAEEEYQRELSAEEETAIISEAGYRFQEMLLEKSQKQRLAAALQKYDPDLAPAEAARVVGQLRQGGDVEYYVADVVASHPTLTALKPGLNAFVPWDTKRIKDARFVVTSDWYSEAALRQMTETPDKSDRWSTEVVDAIIATGPKSLHSMTDLSTMPSWVLSAGVIGQDLTEQAAQNGEKQEFQVLTVYYRASALGGVPAIYRTVFSPGHLEAPLHHTVLPHLRGRYPLVDYVREPRSDTLWGSRGVGELTFSDQEEMRLQVNARSDNAALSIAPPLEVPNSQDGTPKIIKPRAQFKTRKPGETGIRKLDLAGDSRPAIEAERAALDRSNRYWQRGTQTDPVVRSNRWEKLTGDWLLTVKEMEKLTFEIIQNYVPERLRIGAMDGQLAELEIDAADLQGRFSLSVQFDHAVLDPKTVEGRMKMLTEYVSSMDREGLLRTEPVLRLMTMMINPAWGKLLIAKGADQQREDMEDLIRVMSAAMNGVELPYVAGKNHKMRAEMMEQILTLPAMAEDGTPITTAAGQPLPGRMARIMQENPDVAALVEKRMKFERMQADQFDNAQIGRTGVKPSQPTGQLYAGA